jgi:enoyl-[acyl-carrier protein] reductase II
VQGDKLKEEKDGEGSPFYTELCRLLGIKYPIMQGALGGLGGPALVAAVSNAGGLGVLYTWGLPLDRLREMIRRTQKLTSKPFGVNITPISPGFAQSRARVIVEEGVRVVTTGRADPKQSIVAFLRANGIKVIGVAPTVRLAMRLEGEGVDAIVASGCEGGGHVGLVATMALIPQVVNAVKIPVVGAGGIMDYRGFVAALALGACGVQMGTRFVASVESEATLEGKQRLLGAGDEDTVVTTLFTGKTTRVLHSSELDEILFELKRGRSWDELKPQITDLRRKKKINHPEFKSLSCGQGIGLIKQIMPAEEIIKEIVTGAERLCQHLIPGNRSDHSNIF